jgi:undecaprenyl-diphosphatase
VLLTHIVIEAIVQGITEILPVSAYGHRVLTSHILGWPDQGILIDIAVHAGTLLAVMVYFWRDLLEMTLGTIGTFTGRRTPALHLVICLFIATVPVLVIGFFGLHYIERVLRSVELIAWTTLGFGILLWIVDRLSMTVRRIEHMSYAGALLIGLAQVLSLLPGTSRSGIAITAARVLGMERREAARFSMLLSIPTILGASTLAGIEIYKAGDATLRLDAVLAAGLSFVTALVAIALMMRWLMHATFTPFVIYRILLGIGLLYWVYS